MHGPPAPSAIPDLSDGVKQYDMETILKSRKPANGRGIQYLVKWLRYPLLENLWIPTFSFATSMKELIYEFYWAHPDAYWAPIAANLPVQPPRRSTCTYVPWTCALFGLTVGGTFGAQPLCSRRKHSLKRGYWFLSFLHDSFLFPPCTVTQSAEGVHSHGPEQP